MYLFIPAGSRFLATVFRRVFSGGFLFAAIHLALTASHGGAHAEAGSNRADVLPVLVVTPFRSPLAANRTATAITVINRQQVEAWGSKGIADVLRGNPGVDIAENGGPGTVTNLSLRGSNPGQTLVLIDGIRVGDASNIDGSFDFGALTTQDVERIEILRGPQSALYGSDAMGGVINIITRKGKSKPRTVLTIEGGSYGTVSSSLSTSGATERLSYAFSIQGLHSNGFSRYGYRIGRITSLLARPLESDKTTKFGASGRIAYRPTAGTEVIVGFRTYSNHIQFDNPGAFISPKDTRFNKGKQNVSIGFASFSNLVLDGKLKNTVRMFASRTRRFNRIERSCFDALFNSYNCDVRFDSRRIGVEYQGDLKLGRYGLLIFGVKSERESAQGKEKWLVPLSPNMTTFRGNQTTHSIFALYQITLGRWSFSAGGRSDKISGQKAFTTWRGTIAYTISETGTTFRASAGTGAKAPTLFQRFSQYGTPNLQAETNISYEVGIDQSFWNERAKLSITAFVTNYSNLLGFNPALNGGIGGYFNIGRARMQGLEASASVILVPDAWRVRAAYTYLRAHDLVTRLRLLRRPKHKGYLAILYTGIPKLTVETRVTLVGSRIDIKNNFPFGRVKLASYGKLDARAIYKVNENLSVFARIENMTNARYQEIRDYGVAGRSIFGGIKAIW